MIKAFSYRIYPTAPQKRQIQKALDACRWVYNHALEKRKTTWEKENKGLTYCRQNKSLKALKEQHPWLKEVYAHLLQDALRRLDKSFAAFFRRLKAGGKPGYPRFKGRDFYDSFTFQEAGKGGAFLEPSGKRLRLSRIGRVKIRLHRPLEGQLKTCCVVRKADGWHAVLVCDLGEVVVQPAQHQNPVGLDLGLSSFATLSDGTKIENPRLLKAAERELRRATHRLSRRKRGSKRRGKARQMLALKYLDLARARRDWQEKLALDLVRKFNPIVVEDLNIKGMQRKEAKGERKRRRGLRRGIADAAWGQFLLVLERKAAKAGVQVLRVAPEGTTRRCSQCGADVPKTLRERWHRCACGLDIDRDLNAALNILERGRASPPGRVA